MYFHQGDQAVLKCPSGSTGFAKWTCQYGEPQAQWSKSRMHTSARDDIDGPNLSECLSTWISDLDAGLRSGEISVINASQTLADMTSHHKRQKGFDMFGGDILLATRMLKDMSQRMQYEILVSTGSAISRVRMNDITEQISSNIYFSYLTCFYHHSRLLMPTLENQW